MPEAVTSWRPRGVWAGIATPGRFGRMHGAPGCRIQIRRPTLASVVARRARIAEARAALARIVGVAPPSEPRFAAGASGALVWAGPEQWLYVAEEAGAAARLAAALGKLATVNDQSDGRLVLRLSGERVRDVLAKGCAVDLHERAFAPGAAAVTAIAYMGVHLWRPGEPAVFELATARSTGGSFWSWLTASAAEYGYEVDLTS